MCAAIRTRNRTVPVTLRSLKPDSDASYAVSSKSNLSEVLDASSFQGAATLLPR